MYAIYRKEDSLKTVRYELLKTISLFGCNRGYIPRFVRQDLKADQQHPYQWYISVKDALYKDNNPKSAIIIDLKPKEQEANLYELLDIWGHSYKEWTPILFHLRELTIDTDGKERPLEYFNVTNTNTDVPVYSFMYLNGGIEDGGTIGKWTSPPLSSTNGALLWPDALKYFLTCIAKKIPHQ